MEFKSMESLRLMPPVPQTVRVAAQDQMVDGYLIKKGTAIAFSVRGSKARMFRGGLHPLQIFAVNTWQEFWGPDAEEYASVSMLLLCLMQIPFQ